MPGNARRRCEENVMVKATIGILGGTFNPVHNGHLALAETAKKQFGLDRILFVPSAMPPHRREHPESLISSETRYELCALAVKPYADFHVSRIELDRQGPSFTYDTIHALKEQNPQHHYSFICGADTLVHHEWHRFDDLMEILDSLIVLNRGADSNSAVEKIKRSSPESISKVKILQMTPLEISGSDIRARIRNGQNIHNLVPENVAQYIEKHKLYREALHR